MTHPVIQQSSIIFAQPVDNTKPLIFGLGRFFNYTTLLTTLRRSNNSSFQNLWKEFIDSLRAIGYFDIFDINDFQSIVFENFSRILSFDIKPYVLINLFFNFFEKLLSNNCWFMIVENNIIPIRGRPSCELIQIFSKPSVPPIVTFFDKERDCVGVITPDMKCGLVSLSTTNVNLIGLLSYHDEMNKYRVPPSCFRSILDTIFPTSDDDDDDESLLKRIPAFIKIEYTNGFSTKSNLNLVIFKIETFFNVFIKRPDGTFECFSPYFLILMHMFSLNNTLNDLTNQFTHISFVGYVSLVEALVHDCGFAKIFDGSATIEDIIDFMFKSDFGFILQGLCQEFVRFPIILRQHYLEYEEKRRNSDSSFDSYSTSSREKQSEEKKLLIEDYCKSHCDSIRENRFIMDFKRIFEFLLEKLGTRDDLTPEIREILHFLEQLVEFLALSSPFDSN